jgi:hypothetical protein
VDVGWHNICMVEVMNSAVTVSRDPEWPLSLRECVTGIILYQNDQVIMIPAADLRPIVLALAERVRQLVPDSV